VKSPTPPADYSRGGQDWTVTDLKGTQKRKSQRRNLVEWRSLAFSRKGYGFKRAIRKVLPRERKRSSPKGKSAILSSRELLRLTDGLRRKKGFRRGVTGGINTGTGRCRENLASGGGARETYPGEIRGGRHAKGQTIEASARSDEHEKGFIDGRGDRAKGGRRTRKSRDLD